MALALSRLSPDEWSSHLTPVGGSPLIRFGDTLLIVGNAPSRSGRAQLMNDRSVELLSDAPAARFHVAVQTGRRFEVEHPDVPVVFSKGRYLIVDIDPARAATLSKPGCFALRPLQAGDTVFEVRRDGKLRRGTVDERVAELVSRVSTSRLQSRLQRLSAFPTRHSTSDAFAEAALWVHEELRQMGYEVTSQAVDAGRVTTSNVIASKPGAGHDALFVVTAHLDSVNSDGDAHAVAPGADDNASGCAGVLELAALFAEERAAHEVRFVLFGGEEQGLLGSRHFVESLSSTDRRRLRAVVNMDMIGTMNGTSAPSVLIEGAPVSRAVIDELAEAAATYTELSVQTSSHPFNSDHVPFIEAGLPAVLLIEGTDSANANVHTAHDTLEHVDVGLMSAILTMHAAYLAGRVGLTGGIGVSSKVSNPQTWDCDSLIEALRTHQVQVSGTYDYEGGAITRGRRTRAGGREPGEAVLKNPIYHLDQPVYLDEPSDAGVAARNHPSVRFSLAIDVDGNQPLHVVSGAITVGTTIGATLPTHFVGRVTSNTASSEGRDITVQEFEFAWGKSTTQITRLDIVLTGSALTIPSANVTFVDVAQDRRFGPFFVQQRSQYFHEVEVDVDREANAIDPEPLSTHLHPDRPSDLADSTLTLESVFAGAGIRITRSLDQPQAVTGAGADHRWNYSELHDSMVLHWEAFANRPQWKMWIFLAERADDDSLGGVMFDGDIDEPGGVDRQGTALFTRCPFFHAADGDYPLANPPAVEAAKRELFFNLIHETGHAFNLAHSFQKHSGGAYTPPAWMPLASSPQALSWMNYPDSATPGGGTANATWFYRRFRFRFDDSELLFLRHAPDRYVQMGAEAWFSNHARVRRDSLDPRLELSIRVRKPIVEQGEPVLLELKLKNVSNEPVAVHQSLDPSDGLVELAITNPAGERRPYLPFDHTRACVKVKMLEPGKEALYGLADVTMGAFGFHFKQPGAYRIEASYTNVDGRTASAVLQLYVQPPSSYAAVPAINELFDARIGRALYVEGTRVQGEVNGKIDWIRRRLTETIGNRNPIEAHLRVARFKPLMAPASIIEPASNAARILEAQPDTAVHELEPVLVERAADTADTLGHIWYVQMMKAYGVAAEDAGLTGKADEAHTRLVDLCHKRGIVGSVTQEAERALARDRAVRR